MGGDTPGDAESTGARVAQDCTADFLRQGLRSMDTDEATGKMFDEQRRHARRRPCDGRSQLPLPAKYVQARHGGIPANRHPAAVFDALDDHGHRKMCIVKNPSLDQAIDGAGRRRPWKA